MRAVRRKDTKPDLAFGPRRKVVFVHGCFWHNHECQAGRVPKTRQALWVAKFGANKARDERNLVALGKLGWRVMTIWECQLADHEALVYALRSFLDAGQV